MTLDPDQLTHVRPVQTEYAFDNLTLTISHFDLTHTGGRMEGRLSGEGAETFLRQGFILADPDGQCVLSNVLTWDQEGAQDFSFCLSLVPVAASCHGASIWLRFWRTILIGIKPPHPMILMWKNLKAWLAPISWTSPMPCA